MIRVKIETGIYEGMILDVECEKYEDLSTENVFLCTVVESDNANQLAVGSLIYSNDRGLLFERATDVVSNNIDEFIDKQIKPHLTDDQELISYSYVMTTAKGIKEQIECMLPKTKLFQIMYIDKNEKVIRYTIDASIFE